MHREELRLILFLARVTMPALKFIFVRGMFTWYSAVTATLAISAVNVVINAIHKEWIQSYLYLLSTVALCMVYFFFFLFHAQLKLPPRALITMIRFSYSCIFVSELRRLHK